MPVPVIPQAATRERAGLYRTNARFRSDGLEAASATVMNKMTQNTATSSEDEQRQMRSLNGFLASLLRLSIALGIHLIGYHGMRNFDKAPDQAQHQEDAKIALILRDQPNIQG
jgi:hypothetical protein